MDDVNENKKSLENLIETNKNLSVTIKKMNDQFEKLLNITSERITLLKEENEKLKYELLNQRNENHKKE